MTNIPRNPLRKDFGLVGTAPIMVRTRYLWIEMIQDPRVIIITQDEDITTVSVGESAVVVPDNG